MTLNEYGLYVVDSKGHYHAIPVDSEKDIFEEIGMKYLTPKEREEKYGLATSRKVII